LDLKYCKSAYTSVLDAVIGQTEKVSCVVTLKQWIKKVKSAPNASHLTKHYVSSTRYTG